METPCRLGIAAVSVTLRSSRVPNLPLEAAPQEDKMVGQYRPMYCTTLGYLLATGIIGTMLKSPETDMGHIKLYDLGPSRAGTDREYNTKY
jgi:hypothetical protein